MKKFFTLILLASIANLAVAQVYVSFNVDMGTYSETFDEVYIAGNIFGTWATPGSNSDYMLTYDSDLDRYSITVEINEPLPFTVEYKYAAGITGAIDWSSAEWAGGDNRTLTVSENALKVVDGYGDIDAHVVEVILDVNEIDAITKIYPNPSNGLFTIQLDKKAEVKVMNILGSVVYNQNLSGKSKIDLSNQASGIYFLNIDGVSQKIIIK